MIIYFIQILSQHDNEYLFHFVVLTALWAFTNAAARVAYVVIQILHSEHSNKGDYSKAVNNVFATVREFNTRITYDGITVAHALVVGLIVLVDSSV